MDAGLLGSLPLPRFGYDSNRSYSQLLACVLGKASLERMRSPYLHRTIPWSRSTIRQPISKQRVYIRSPAAAGTAHLAPRSPLRLAHAQVTYQLVGRAAAYQAPEGLDRAVVRWHPTLHELLE